MPNFQMSFEIACEKADGTAWKSEISAKSDNLGGLRLRYPKEAKVCFVAPKSSLIKDGFEVEYGMIEIRDLEKAKKQAIRMPMMKQANIALNNSLLTWDKDGEITDLTIEHIANFVAEDNENLRGRSIYSKTITTSENSIPIGKLGLPKSNKSARLIDAYRIGAEIPGVNTKIAGCVKNLNKINIELVSYFKNPAGNREIAQKTHHLAVSVQYFSDGRDSCWL